MFKARDDLKCDKAPISPVKDLCNLITDTIAKLAKSLRSAPAPQNIFTAPAITVLDTTETKLNNALGAINAGTAPSGSTLKEGDVEDAIDEVKKAKDELSKGDEADAIEKLTKSSKELDCDNGPVAEQPRQEICDAIIDAIAAVADDMRLP